MIMRGAAVALILMGILACQPACTSTEAGDGDQGGLFRCSCGEIYFIGLDANGEIEIVHINPAGEQPVPEKAPRPERPTPVDPENPGKGGVAL